MDRAIDANARRRARLRRLVLATAIAGVIAAGGAYAATRSGGRSLRVDRSHLTIDTVARASYDDFVPVSGEALPQRSVFLDAVEGGRVERVLVEPGATVTAGQLLVELSNPTLQLDVISREAQVTEQLNQLRTVELALEQARLAQDRERVEIDYQLERAASAVERLRQLAPSGAVAAADLEAAEQEHSYLRRRRALAVESAAVNDGLRRRQLAQLQGSAVTLREHLGFARRHLGTLELRAPVDGTLTALDAQVGQLLGHGQRAGQIDVAGPFKIVAKVDQFYADRIRVGQRAVMTDGAGDHALTVAKVYPLVDAGRFTVDLTFTGDAPADLRRGQAVAVRLVLGDTTDAVVVPTGPFLVDSAGRFVFVVDGDRAVRRAVELGRHNPRQVEVVRGLAPGERVVTSSYRTYLTASELTLD
jgi:HlyD family secretion protein